MSLTHFRCYQIYYTVLLHNVTFFIPLSYKFALNFVLSVNRLKECWLSHCFLAWSVFVSYAINPRTYTQFHIPTVLQRVGGGGERVLAPLTRGFEMLQYFVTILPSVESLWSSLQDEVYFMGGGATRGLLRHQQWSPPWPPSWILQRIRNQVKTAINGNF